MTLAGIWLCIEEGIDPHRVDVGIGNRLQVGAGGDSAIEIAVGDGGDEDAAGEPHDHQDVQADLKPAASQESDSVVPCRPYPKTIAAASGVRT